MSSAVYRFLFARIVKAERARKNAENELAEASSRVSELSLTITSISTDKRRYEGELATLRADLDEALAARQAAEDRADRAQLELNRLLDEFRHEQENYRNADAGRKQLEVEIRQLATRLEQAESFAQREGKRLVDKLQARVRTQRSLKVKVTGELNKTSTRFREIVESLGCT